MKKIDDIIELHEILLGIGFSFHNICESNNIPYYMLGGTMLGAIRHKGFIPWDDDMDFGVPRRYFNNIRFLLIKNLPHYYRVRTVKDHPGVFGEVIKVEDTRTVVIEKSKEDERFRMGAFIDIFPLDYSDDGIAFLSRNWWVFHVIQAHSYSINDSNNWKSIILKTVTALFKDFQLLDLVKYVVKNDGDFVANYYGFWGVKEIVPRKYFGDPILYDFEKYKFFGVCCPDGYLSCLYGDYMKLPSANKRHTHIVSMYYK